MAPISISLKEFYKWLPNAYRSLRLTTTTTVKANNAYETISRQIDLTNEPEWSINLKATKKTKSLSINM
jgi:hypothetical protein